MKSELYGSLFDDEGDFATIGEIKRATTSLMGPHFMGVRQRKFHNLVWWNEPSESVPGRVNEPELPNIISPIRLCHSGLFDLLGASHARSPEHLTPSDSLLGMLTVRKIVDAQKAPDRAAPASLNLQEVKGDIEERLVGCISNRAFEAMHDDVRFICLAKFSISGEIEAYEDERFLEHLLVRLNLSVMKSSVLADLLKDVRRYVASGGLLRGSWGRLKYGDLTNELSIAVGSRASIRSFARR